MVAQAGASSTACVRCARAGTMGLPPDWLQIRAAVAWRVIELRRERHNSRGAAAFARELGIPERSWYLYEHGTAMPGELLLKIVELTGVEPMWLLYGTEPKYRTQGDGIDPEHERKAAVDALVRAALDLVDRGLTEIPPQLPEQPRKRGGRRTV